MVLSPTLHYDIELLKLLSDSYETEGPGIEENPGEEGDEKDHKEYRRQGCKEAVKLSG